MDVRLIISVIIFFVNKSDLHRSLLYNNVLYIDYHYLHILYWDFSIDIKKLQEVLKQNYKQNSFMICEQKR